MPWLQLLVDSDREYIDAIENALLDTGAVSVTLQERIPQGQTEQPILEPNLGETPLWDHARITGLFNADCDTRTLDLRLTQTWSSLAKPPQWRWEQLEDKDWEREWMDHYHPIQCGDNLWICPSWRTPPDPNAVNLLLDPGLAFGTGTHPTTFLCLQWLAQQDLTNQIVVDYGCGSGILGIAALLLGAEKAIGFDIDPQALTATHDNVERNGLDHKDFPVFLPTDTAAPALIEQADMVLANILAGPLVELRDDLISRLKPGGKLCLSGVLADQTDAILGAYQSAIDFEPVAQQEPWVRICGTKH